MMDDFTRAALEALGLLASVERLLAGEAGECDGQGEPGEPDGQGAQASPSLVQRLRGLPLPLLCAVADAVRDRHRGSVVVLHGGRRAPDPATTALVDVTDLTGPEALRAVACARLAAPAWQAVGVSLQRAGLPLAELCLTAGADALVGGPGIAGGLGAGRAMVDALVLRNGRRIHHHETSREAEPRRAEGEQRT